MCHQTRQVSAYIKGLYRGRSHLPCNLLLPSNTTIEVALWQFLKEVLNSTYVGVCLMVYEKHKGGTVFVLFSQCH